MRDDLISRKEAIDILEDMIFEVGKDLSKSHLLQAARKRIIGLNTAFDKEKVVKKIKDESREERLEDVSISGNVYGYNIERVINEEDVIEIIEKGGNECDFM